MFNKSMKIYVYSIILVLILSAVFRLGFPNQSVFGMDEDTICCRILDHIHNHRMPPLIAWRHGVYVINFLEFLFYIIFWFFRDPRVIAIIFNGIPNTAAVLLCFLFCYRFINKRTAMLSSALFGFSGWSILYSKGLWGVNEMQFFSIFVFYIIALNIARPGWMFTALLFLSLLIIPTLHLTSFSIIVSVFLILFIFCRRKLRLKKIFIVIGLLVFLSVFAFIFIAGLYRKIKLHGTVFMPAVSLKAVFTSFDIIVRGRWFYGYIGVMPEFPMIDMIFEILLKILFLFGCVYVIKKMCIDLKNNRLSGYVIVGIWYYVFVILFGLTNLTPHLHYFMVVMPALYIICSIGFFSIIDYMMKREKIEQWELFLYTGAFMLWSPWAAVTAVFIAIIIWKYNLFKDILRKISFYSLYVCIVFFLAFQVFTNFRLYAGIEKKGGVSGRAGLDIGSKIEAVRYIVDDAQKTYGETGKKSFYSIENDAWYGYLFKYMTSNNENFISEDIDEGVYNYKIINDLEGTWPIEKTENYIWHKRFGCILVIKEKDAQK